MASTAIKASKNLKVEVESHAGELPWGRVGLLFLGSGCAALVYEIIWFHLLRLVIGASSVSLAIVLGTFMGGMCLGSLLLPWVVSARFHPLKVYAALEMGIGLIGATLPHWLPWLGNWYLATADVTGRDLFARSLVATGCLLPATVLMGATLPAIARWVKSTPTGMSRLGVFYGMNTLGAVLGCFVAGFLLLPQTDVVYASYVAAAVNGIVALVAWSMAGSLEYVPPPKVIAKGTSPNAPLLVCVIVALSGFAALTGEVVWTRLLALLYGATTYTFAIILMVFLAGIGLGSTVAARFAQNAARPLRWLALCQLALLPVLAIANAVVTRIVPHWPPDASGMFYVYFIFLHDALRTFVAIFPAAVLWGASFSFAIAAVGRGQPDTGKLVGQLFASNTFGAIVGSLLTTLWLVPAVGSQRTQQLMVLASAVAAGLSLYADRWQEDVANSGTWRDLSWVKHKRIGWALVGLTIASFALLLPLPHGILGNSIMPWAWHHFSHLYEKETQNTTVVVMNELSTGIRSLCVAGKVEASNNPDDLRCQRMLGHMPALIHPQPKTTLTVGLGAGTTAGCFALYPEVERILVCEIEPEIVDAAGGFFAKDNHQVVTDSRTEIVIDDARHFMATCQDKFDIISSDSIHPWVRGSAILYSKEYYELCRARLNPGGVFVQWIPLYQTDMMTVSCELATFLDVFPNATLWSSGRERNHGYDIIAVAQTDDTRLDLVRLEKRIAGNPNLRKSLNEVRLGSVDDLFKHYVGRGRDLGGVLAGAEINKESSLKLEYMAGMASHFQAPDAILKLILEPLKYPSDWLTNDEAFRDRLYAILGLPAPTNGNEAEN